MEEAPILQITVLKGPRNGEILVCNPDSTIHIGRVMKGNNLALRDPGISQKHLRFRFVQDDFGWFVSDLDTSNGTKLNGSLIEASVLVRVSDGDVFEIGEKTKLGVKIVAQKALDVKGVPGRRVTRRGGSSGVNSGANSSRVSGEEVGLKEAQPKVSAQVRSRKTNEKPSSSGFEMGQKGTGRGKGKAVKKNASRVLEKEEPRDSVMVSCSDAEEPDQDGEANVRRNPRRGRASKVLKEIDGNCVVDSGLVAKKVGVKRKGKGEGRRTTSTISMEDKENDDSAQLKLDEDKENDDGLVLKLDILSSESSDPDQVEIPEPRKGIRARSSAGSSVVMEEKGEEDVKVEDEGVEEGERNSEESRVDFEKMTLDEWFDRVELVLPKMIHEEAERIIVLLKEKARKFDELLEADTDAA